MSAMFVTGCQPLIYAGRPCSRIVSAPPANFLSEQSAAPRSVGAGDPIVTLDAAAIDRFRAGDEDAVRLVYREYGRLVFAVAMRVLGQRELAEEAAQQAFVQAWRAAGTFDDSKSLGPWLATIARRVAIDVHRREARRTATALDDVPTDHGALVVLPPSVDSIHDAWAVREAVDELPADEREVVRMQHLEGFTQIDIAERLGLPLGTVKSRSYRAHRRLAARLGHLRGDPA